MTPCTLRHQSLHIPDPHLGHVFLLFRADMSELIGIFSESKGLMYSVTHADEQPRAGQDEDDDGALGDCVAGVALREGRGGCGIKDREEDDCSCE